MPRKKGGSLLPAESGTESRSSTCQRLLQPHDHDHLPVRTGKAIEITLTKCVKTIMHFKAVWTIWLNMINCGTIPTTMLLLSMAMIMMMMMRRRRGMWEGRREERSGGGRRGEGRKGRVYTHFCWLFWAQNVLFCTLLLPIQGVGTKPMQTGHTDVSWLIDTAPFKKTIL